MSKSKKAKNYPKKESAPKKSLKTEVKTVEKKIAKKIEVKKPDLSGLKQYNYKPVLKILGLIIVIIATIALVDLAVQFFNNSYSIAVVNNSRIPRNKWTKEIEKIYGKAMSAKMIDDEIIKLEAKKANVEVTEKDIEDELNTYRERMGGEEKLQSTLLANNFTVEQLKEQIKTDLMLRKILEPSLQYTEDDIKNFFNQYSDVIFPTEAAALEEGEKLDYEKYKEQTTDWYKRQLVESNMSDWLNTKRSEYNIRDNAKNQPKYGFLTTTIDLINTVVDKIKK